MISCASINPVTTIATTRKMAVPRVSALDCKNFLLLITPIITHAMVEQSSLKGRKGVLEFVEQESGVWTLQIIFHRSKNHVRRKVHVLGSQELLEINFLVGKINFPTCFQRKLEENES